MVELRWIDIDLRHIAEFSLKSNKNIGANQSHFIRISVFLPLCCCYSFTLLYLS